MLQGATGGMPSKRLIAQSFCAAAEAYDRVAAFQRRIGFELLERIPVENGYRSVLDVGAGTGFLASEIERRNPGSHVYAVDIAEGMIRQARSRLRGSCLIGDAEMLPVTGRSIDLLVSNLAIQWCHSLDQTFTEFARVLRHDGILGFSTFGLHTLKELRAAWASVDDQSHVNVFQTHAAISSALVTAGLRPDFLAETEFRISYSSPLALMRELKGLGAHNITHDRPRHLMGRARFAQMLAQYRALSGGGAGSIEATFHVVLGIARQSLP